MRRAIALAAGLAAGLAGAEARAATYAVVVGIDDYANFNDLDGAVNDAEDIAAALERRGADVELITDARATRSAIVGALRAQIAKARAGDAVVFTYAGHGLQLDEALVGDEADGRDENFVLHGFAESGPGAAERLRDNDISMLFGTAPPGVSVLFVADSCHSGTMTRGPTPGGALGKTRFLESSIGAIEDDPLPPPDQKSFQVEATDLPNVVFAAAARDEEQTPEVKIDGRSRGALSWSIARAIEGRADGGDGETSLADLREFVRAQVRAYSGARQTPDVEFASAEVDGVLRLLNGDDARADGVGAGADANGSNEAAAAAAGDGMAGGGSDAAEALAPARAPTLQVVGELGDEEREAMSEVADLVETADEAEIVWDRASGRLIDRLSADLLAEATSPDHVAAAIRKWRAVAGLARWSPRRAFDLRVSDGDRRHLAGDSVRFLANAPESGPEIGALTLFNLASGGEVQYVYPGPKTAKQGKDLLRRGGTLDVGPATVSEPFGADHMIGVVSATGVEKLREALLALNGRQAPEEALKILAEHAADPAAARVAVLPLFSGRTEE